LRATGPDLDPADRRIRPARYNDAQAEGFGISRTSPPERRPSGRYQPFLPKLNPDRGLRILNSNYRVQRIVSNISIDFFDKKEYELELRQLKRLKTAADSSSVNKAAGRLHHVQSGISILMESLEGGPQGRDCPRPRHLMKGRCCVNLDAPRQASGKKRFLHTRRNDCWNPIFRSTALTAGAAGFLWKDELTFFRARTRLPVKYN